MALDPDRPRYTDYTAAEQRELLLRLMSSLVKDAAKLGEVHDAGDQRAHRAKMRHQWRQLPGSLHEFERHVQIEAKRAVRDALHSQLCQIVRRAESNKESMKTPWIFWKNEIDRVIDWLDRFIK